jgi:hypothetical protein
MRAPPYENKAGDYWSLKDAYLKDYYAVYDYQQHRFGFAPSAHSKKTKVEKVTLFDTQFLPVEEEKSNL